MHAAALPTILLTGFAPFDGATVNASWEAVRRLDGATLGGHRVQSLCLPTVFGKAGSTLETALAEHQPAAVIAVGQADGRDGISLERVAINIVDARIPDNDGAQPIDRPVLDDGPAAYFSTLPLKPMLVALHAANIPAEISCTAGTFVCNHLFYRLCHALRARPDVPAGFVHLPLLDSQAADRDVPSMSCGMLVEALAVLVRAVIDPPAVPPGLSAGREN
jgi:pyroglutamyl-peptidase